MNPLWIGDPAEAARGDSGDFVRDAVTVVQFLRAIFEQLHQRAVDVAEAQKAEVIGSDGSRAPVSRFQSFKFQSKTVIPGVGNFETLLLPHHRSVFRLDFVEDADFAGLAVGVFIDTEIFLRHLVDVFGGAFFGDLNNASADFEITIRIFGINDGDRHARVAADIAVLLPSPGGVEDEMIAVEIAPHRRNLRASIGHEGAQAGEGPLLEKIFVLVGDGLRHEVLQKWFSAEIIDCGAGSWFYCSMCRKHLLFV